MASQSKRFKKSKKNRRTTKKRSNLRKRKFRGGGEGEKTESNDMYKEGNVIDLLPFIKKKYNIKDDDNEINTVKQLYYVITKYNFLDIDEKEDELNKPIYVVLVCIDTEKTRLISEFIKNNTNILEKNAIIYSVDYLQHNNIKTLSLNTGKLLENKTYIYAIGNFVKEGHRDDKHDKYTITSIKKIPNGIISNAYTKYTTTILYGNEKIVHNNLEDKLDVYICDLSPENANKIMTNIPPLTEELDKPLPP